MAQPFAGLKIVGLNEKVTRPSGEDAFYRVAFDLSSTPPVAWAEFFNASFAENFDMMKRQGEISGNNIVIVCPMDEVEHQLDQARKIVSSANAKYERYLDDRERSQQILIEEENRQCQSVADLKSRLKFD